LESFDQQIEIKVLLSHAIQRLSNANLQQFEHVGINYDVGAANRSSSELEISQISTYFTR
jgi:hypothetical protein